MKKIKYLPLICLTPFLVTGCNKVIKPSFKKSGLKIDAQSFVYDLTKMAEKNSFLNKESLDGSVNEENFSSFILKSHERSVSKSYLKRGNKKFDRVNTSTNNRFTLKYSSNRNVLKEQSKTYFKNSVSHDSFHNSETIRNNSTTFTQEAKKDGEIYAARIDENRKQYEFLNASYFESFEDYLKFYLILTIKDNISSFLDSVVCDQEYVTYYENDGIFTIEIDEKAEDRTETREDIIFYVENNSNYEKAQLQFLKNDEIRVLYYSETHMKRNYKIAGDGYCEGDELYEITSSSVTTKIKKKDVKVKSKDLSKYKESIN